MTSVATPASESRSSGAPRPERGYYKSHMGDLPTRLRAAIPQERLKELHERSGGRHALVAVRHIALFLAALVTLIAFESPWIWVPVAALQGTFLLGFIILLHDVIHGAVFRRRRPVASKWLGRLYAVPTAIAASQFERWHLDHHKELGSADEDPKRAHLSPKRNSRLLKLLYATPVLFVIYARAAGKALAGYPTDLQRAIRLERLANVVIHLGVVFGLGLGLGWDVALRAWIVPLFVFFPVAFMVNRLGQHYWIDPEDPAKWGTRVDGGLLVDFLSLNSNLHLEHHYFPGVPLYRLPALNRELRPFWDGIGHPSRTYRALLWKWFVENREAHTDWDRPPA